jgi:heparan-alpha-glucosaminide N-acetyltransferase
MARLKSIDILRALTMLLMIFVNDLWSLAGIPEWLEHKAADVDGMGLADVVFPAFLFIVGLSVPHAIRARLKKGDSKLLIFRHIVERTLALLVMGVFMVNIESIDRDALIISKPIWQILMALAFFLIWNVYRGKVIGKISPLIMKLAGWLILLFLAIIYKAPDHGEGTWMHFHWWGILGLIGWAYLVSATIYLLLGNKPGWISLSLLILYLLNINEFATPFNLTLKIVVSASNYASVMGGVLATVLLIQLQERKKINNMIPILLAIASILLLFGFLTRPVWGISKIMATPSWTAICSGISMLAFVFMYVLTDKLGIYRWADFIKAAGTSTLTCYLIPYFVYGLWVIIGLTPIEFLNTGLVGILKSLLFSILIIQLTGLLGRWNIKLKI